MSFKFLKSIFAAGALVLAASYAFTTSAYSIEVNFNGFTGTINSSVSSGVSVRVGARDCSLLDGYAYAEADATGAAVIAGTLAARVAGGATTSASTNMTSYVSGSGGGCATYRTDNYEYGSLIDGETVCTTSYSNTTLGLTSRLLYTLLFEYLQTIWLS